MKTTEELLEKMRPSFWNKSNTTIIAYFVLVWIFLFYTSRALGVVLWGG